MSGQNPQTRLPGSQSGHGVRGPRPQWLPIRPDCSTGRVMIWANRTESIVTTMKRITKSAKNRFFAAFICWFRWLPVSTGSLQRSGHGSDSRGNHIIRPASRCQETSSRFLRVQMRCISPHRLKKPVLSRSFLQPYPGQHCCGLRCHCLPGFPR